MTTPELIGYHLGSVRGKPGLVQRVFGFFGHNLKIGVEGVYNPNHMSVGHPLVSGFHLRTGPQPWFWAKTSPEMDSAP